MSVTVSKELLARLDRPGPRYTSYPTVPVWSTDFGGDQYGLALRELATSPDSGLSLYLHLPFCVKRCHYCGCNATTASGTDAVDRYLDRVDRELDLICAVTGHRRVVQMHWGGGTPNFLDSAQLDRAISMIRKRFSFSADAEISLEADPRIGTPEQAAVLRELGFNRISLGVQDFQRDVQVAIGRVQPTRLTTGYYSACREAGFSSVNIDLVYGLPRQTEAGFADTLSQVIDIAPDRIACFGYAHVPWARPNQAVIDDADLPAPEQRFAFFQQAVDTLSGAGYRWIGLDHFARPEDELTRALDRRALHRNFMGYTTRPASELIAVGMSGISEVAGRFAQNDADLQGYTSSIDAGRLPIVRGLVLSREDRLRRQVILDLMCNLELRFDSTEIAFEEPLNLLLPTTLSRLEPLAADGLVIIEEDRLRVTELGHFFLRNIAMVFDGYLDPEDSQPLFSRTV